jgi:hypothetical protein
MFRQSNTEPLSSFVLLTPQHKQKSGQEERPHQDASKSNHRQSPRLKEKSAKGKPILKMAQELVAKKCGFLKDEKELDNMTLQNYLNMYKQPLSEESIAAMQKLTEVALEKKPKKKGKEKKLVGEGKQGSTMMKKKDKKGKKEKKGSKSALKLAQDPDGVQA